jgi:lipopolysaccharide/colanic/teichoic acid biosynthesis glycosyltransferase
MEVTSAAEFAWKRPLDIAVSCVALVLLAPVLLVLVVLVRLDSPGPALFRQERIGRLGKPFWMLKLRSMRLDGGDAHHRAAALAWFTGEPRPAGYKSSDDPRVTRIGRFLRRTCLDELPQLVNVLRGEMSLVGPRPAIPYELGHYEPWFFIRQLVAPGMTGLWQVSRRRDTPARTMMELDVRYVREATLSLDLAILARTALCVLRRLGGTHDGWH